MTGKSSVLQCSHKLFLRFIIATLLLISLVTVGISCQGDSPTPVIFTGIDSVQTQDGVTIVYDVQGRGEVTLLFIHCWSCDRTYFDDIIPLYTDSFRVVTIDLGGHGESSLGRENWTIEAFGDDVVAVMNKLELSNVFLVGHSMGGAVMIEAALQAPDRVKALIGIDNLQDLKARFTEEQIETILIPLRENFVNYTKNYIKGIFGPATDSAIVERVAADMSSAPPEVAVSAIDNLLHYDFQTKVPELTIPIRCINSGMTQTNVVGNREIAMSFEAKVIKHVGHFPHLEKPDQFNNALKATCYDLKEILLHD